MHRNFFSKWKEKITKKSGCKPLKPYENILNDNIDN